MKRKIPKEASAEIKKLRASGALFFVQPEDVDPAYRAEVLKAKEKELKDPDVSRKISNLQKARSRQNSLEFEFLTTIREELRKLKRKVRERMREESLKIREDKRKEKLEKERLEFESLSPLEQKQCLKSKKRRIKKSVRTVKLRKG